MKLKLFTALSIAALIVAPLSAVAGIMPKADPAAVERFGKLPLSFEPTESSSRFVAHSGGYAVSIGSTESSIAVLNAKSGKSRLLRFGFEKSNGSAQLQASDPLPGVTNYYIGSDPGKWRLGVKNYGRLRASAVYPGVDVVYYGDNRRLEFDFVVSPKADPSAIALSFSGMDKLYKDAAGDIVAEINGKPVRFAKPYAYQQIDGVSKIVSAEYVLSSGRARLQLGDYDHSRELIVDPVVSYATYLGGSGTDSINAVTVDSSGAVYVTGTTSSADFPAGSLQGASNAFLVKYTADGTSKVFTNVLGGTTPYNASASGNAIALDEPTAANPNATNVYIAGTTNITDLPGSGSLGNANRYAGGDSDAFIMIFSTSNGSLVRMSYLGGGAADSAYGIAVDSKSNVVVVGQTCSWDFPGYSAFETKTEVCVAYVTKLDNNLDIGSPRHNSGTPGYLDPLVSALGPAPSASGGERFYFSETFGGQPVAPPTTAGVWEPCTAYPQYAIVEDTSNPPNAQLSLNAGTSGIYEQATTTSSIPIPQWNTTIDGTTQDGMTQATSCGGTGNPLQPAAGIVWMALGAVAPFPGYYTEAYGVALDPQDDIFLVGGTTSTALNSKWTWPGMCVTNGIGAWILKVGANDGGCIYLHTMESTPTDQTATVDTARAIAVDPSGRAYVTGTMSTSYGSAGGGYAQPASGGTDAFLIRWNTAGSAIEYGASIGGSANDQGLGVAVDRSGAAYLTGSTQSANFPLVNPLVDPNSTPVANSPIATLSGGQDAFVAKFSADGSALLFSGYLGGSAFDQGNGIATDPTNQGNIYVGGSTLSPDLISNLVPMSGGAFTPYVPPQPNSGGNSDGFLAMIAGNTLPIVTVLPGSLQFSYEDVGATSDPASVTYYNTSALSSVNITNIQFTGDFSQVFMNGTPADCSPGEMLPGTKCTVWVAFRPSVQGTRTGTLSITDDASSAAHVVNLSGVGATPFVVLSAASLNFSNVYLGTTSSVQYLTVQNTGKGTLNFSGITPSGDFSVPSAYNTCDAAVAPGGSCTVGVEFTPTIVGTESGVLTLAYNSSESPATVGLRGTVATVTNSISPASFNFGSQAVGSTSSAQAITITNTDSGTHMLYVNAAATNSTEFVVTSNGCTTSVSPGNSCTVQVEFAPASSGVRNGNLTISGNGTGMPYTVSLSGTGITGAGVLGVSPTILPLSAVAGSNTSGQVTISNKSTASTLTGLSVSLSSNASGYFTIPSGGNSCGASLAANATCTVTINFAPPAGATGASSATLTVAADNNGSQTVAVTGTVGSGGGGGGGTGEFTMAASSNSVSVTQGNIAIYNITITPQNSPTDTLTFSCSGPSGSTCTISPKTLKWSGSSAGTVVTLSVATNGGSGGMSKMVMPGFVGRQAIFALLPFTLAGLLLARRRRNLWVVLVLLAICLVMGMSACGSSSSSSGGSSGSVAVGGPYTVTFTATTQSGTAVPLNPSLQLYVTSH